MRLRSAGTALTVCITALATCVAGGPTLPASAASDQPGVGEAAPAPASDGGERGRWSVAEVGVDRYTVAWTSPSPLLVTDARPEIVADGTLAGTPTLRPDGRTVTVTIDSSTVPDMADYDVVLSGQTLDEPAASTPVDAEPYRAVAQLTQLPTADDPGLPGSHPIQSGDYRLATVKLPDIALKSEMLGHVVEPTDADENSPLVLFLHGRHSACYLPDEDALRGIQRRAAATGDWRCRGGSEPVPSYLGYDYAQRLLASQGYVTVSISANAINDLDFDAPDGGAAARAALIRAHLIAWAGFVADDTHRADLSNVVVIGHSRGGEGANRAVLDERADSPYHITGQVLLGPTDFGFQAAPSTPTVTLLPYCDGDVSDLQGQNFTDAARDLTDDLAFHSSVLVMGANHNFFNTEWTPGLSVAPSFDDWGGGGPARTKTCGRLHPMRLSKQGQQDVGSTYIAGAVHLFTGNDQSVLPMYDGSAVTVASADDADVRSHAIGGGLDIRRPGVDAAIATGATAATRFCTGQAEGRAPRLCEAAVGSARTPHWPSDYIRGVSLRRAWETSWSAVDQESGLALDESWNVAAAESLDLRTILQPGHGVAELHVRLTDGSGATAVVEPEGGGRLVPLPGGGYSLAKRWAQDLRLPLDGVTGVDLTDIVSVGLVSATATGRVWVLDITAHPTGALPAPPAEALPTISLGEITQQEGDGPGEDVLKVPYTIAGGPTSTETSVRMIPMNGLFDYAGQSQVMHIPAGTTSGTIDLPYLPNVVDDFPRTRRGVAVFPLSGIATDDYVGAVTVLDDDPTPTVTIKPVRKRIREGATARWVVTLSSPTGYYVGFVGEPVRGTGDGKRLTVGDLPKRFRNQVLYPIPPLDRPLFKTDLLVFEDTRPGQTRVMLKLPTRVTKEHQGRRSITLRFHASDGFRISKRTSTIVVTD